MAKVKTSVIFKRYPQQQSLLLPPYFFEILIPTYIKVSIISFYLCVRAIQPVAGWPCDRIGLSCAAYLHPRTRLCCYLSP